ncbi:UNVERIFIED_CONTAM: hypothetical protein HDU68_008341 [Siphonaria sp. JEL0065]|nr:hypothetical protein HDU68_008341 [Siphonaria sp. JEL0065]
MIFESISIPSEMPPVSTGIHPSQLRQQLQQVHNQQQQQAQPRASPRRFTETWKGFIKDATDASMIIEACVANMLQPLNIVPMSLSDLQIRSGTVLVFAENSSMGQMVRWRDGCRWSASRLQGPFLLYREVEASNNNSSMEVERDVRFVNTVVRGKTMFVANGMAKRTLTLTGSDGNRYRVISYFYPCDVGHLYGDPVVDKNSQMLACPSQLPEFSRFANKVVVPPFTIPDLSYSALNRSSSGSTLAAMAASSSSSSVSTSAVASSSSSRPIMGSPRNQLIQIQQRTNEQGQYHEHMGHKSVPYPSPHQKSYTVNKQYHPQRIVREEELNADAFSHPIFQIQQCRPAQTPILNNNGSNSLAASSTSGFTCKCGGLGIRKAVDYFRSDPFWTEFPIVLAPLRNLKKDSFDEDPK